MANAHMTNPAANQPTDGAMQEEAERTMRELLASLPPLPDHEALARAQGVLPITSLDDLPRWPEDDMDVWEGFDEWLAERRRTQHELQRQRRDEDADRW